MKIAEAIWYLTPIRDSASLERYREALTTAIDALNYQLHHEHPLTNADRIRAMSDEEMADILAGQDELDDRIHFCLNLPECEDWLETADGVPEHKCKDCVLKWLRRPAKEE